MPLAQKNRDIAVATPLGPDALVLRRMVGTEGLSRLFEFELDLISDNPNIDPRQLLGQAASVRLTTQNNQPRYFHGQVARFILTSHATTQDQARYRATLRPWFWLLTRTTDCRIFQDKTVPDIIQQILGEYGYTTYLDDRLHGDYRTWEYCVQYRESDFDFLSRLMEQEGIYYYFEHQADRHNLILADGYPAHGPAPGYETIPYYPPANEIRRQRQHIHRWDLIQEVQPGRYTLKDYDHHKPRDPLLADYEDPRGHAADDFEIYDYPGEYRTTGEGKNYARIRLEEREAEFEVAHARANAAGLSSGFLFTLAEYPRADQNREYLVTAANHTLSNDEFETGGKGETDYHCRFQAIDARTQYRPPRRTPRPVVQGIQTAIVTGKPGEEIWTDKQGRVKVQFHWDREGKRNEHTSCWIRVAQLWAGGNWGAMFIPRVGQEVIVEYLEGDPDRPVITGRLYNASNRPPLDLPSNATQSVIRSNSTGTPPPSINQRSQNLDVALRNAASELLGQSSDNHVPTALSENSSPSTIFGTLANELLNADSQLNQATSGSPFQATTRPAFIKPITNNIKPLSPQSDANSNAPPNGQSHFQGQNSKVSTSPATNSSKDQPPPNPARGFNEIRFDDKRGSEEFAMHAEKNLTINTNWDETKTGGNNQSISIGNDQSLQVGNNQIIAVGTDATEQVGNNKSISVGDNFIIDAGSSITLKCGASTISMTAAGIINITGTMINIAGMANVNCAAPITTVTGAAMLNLNSIAWIQMAGMNITIDGTDIATTASGKLENKSGGSMVNTSTGTMTTTVGGVAQVAAGTMVVTTTGNLTLVGSRVDINP
jgi:type VI secretion system secreted protein VgrG